MFFCVFSQVIGPRHPFKKDPNLDYDIDSDEEWEEECLSFFTHLQYFRGYI